jgi:membrane protein required for colicin V production
MSDVSYALNGLDYTIISIIGLSTLISLVRGFVREALSLAVWVIAIFFAFKFSTPFSDYLSSYIASETVRLAAAFATLLLSSLIIGGLMTHFLVLLMHKTGLSTTDRLLGVIFGLFRGILLVVILIFIGQFSQLKTQDWWKHSQLVPQFEPLVEQFEKLLPQTMKQLPDYLETKVKSLEQNTGNQIESEENFYEKENQPAPLEKEDSRNNPD